MRLAKMRLAKMRLAKIRLAETVVEESKSWVGYERGIPCWLPRE
jgi:hypothetical protein